MLSIRTSLKFLLFGKGLNNVDLTLSQTSLDFYVSAVQAFHKEQFSPFVFYQFEKLPFNLTHSHTMTPFDPSGNKPFENTVGKGEIARNEQFLLFPQCFLPVWITFFHFRQI